LTSSQGKKISVKYAGATWNRDAARHFGEMHQ
jgi:hypothetical protein